MPKGIENWEQKTDRPTVKEWENKKTGEFVQIYARADENGVTEIWEEKYKGKDIPHADDKAHDDAVEDPDIPTEYTVKKGGNGFPASKTYHDGDKAMERAKNYMKNNKDEGSVRGRGRAYL